MPFDFREELSIHAWEPGKVIRLVIGSYRHRVDVICSPEGRNLAMFYNGEHKYFACITLLRGDGSEVRDGNCIVPRLPNHRFLMVVELRPALNELGDLVMVKSLECPGGAVDHESVTLGCLRECREETGIPLQKAILYRRRPVSPMSSDVVCRNHYCVVLLSEGSFETNVETDGGLQVVSMTEAEIDLAMFDGTISHGPSHLAWDFYKMVRSMHPREEQDWIEKGHLTKEEVTI